MIDSPTWQMLCDGIDDGARMIVFLLLVLMLATVTFVGGALFLGLAIRYAVRSIVRRFAERRI